MLIMIILRMLEENTFISWTFVLKKRLFKKMIEDAESLLVIDHHKTAQKELCDIPKKYQIFNMNKSGAVLAWEYFFPDEEVPLLFLYIQDRDIWTKKLKTQMK